MQWKILKENSNYEISEYGDVRSLKSWKILTPDTRRNYNFINLCKNGKRKQYFIHRLVANNYLPPPLIEQIEWAKTTHWKVVQVNHIKPLEKKNNHYSNLEWATGKENIKHADDHNLKGSKKKEKTHKKLSNIEITYLKNNYLRGHSIYGTKGMAISLNVCSDTILKYLKK